MTDRPLPLHGIRVLESWGLGLGGPQEAPPLPLGHWTGFLLALAVVIPAQALVLWWIELRKGVRAGVFDQEGRGKGGA